MNCPHCGEQVPEKKRFCGYCGGELASYPAPTIEVFDEDAPTVLVQENETETPSPSSESHAPLTPGITLPETHKPKPVAPLPTSPSPTKRSRPKRLWAFVGVVAVILIGFVLIRTAIIDTTPPPRPTLVNPVDGTVADYYPRELTLDWSDVHDPSGVEYWVELETCSGYLSDDSISSCTTVETIGFIERSNYEINWYGAQAGRWRVWAVDGAGNVGSATDWWYFEFLR